MQAKTIVLFIISAITFTSLISCSHHQPSSNAAPTLDASLRDQWPKSDAPNEPPVVFNEVIDNSADLTQKFNKSKTCATFNYNDIGLPCLKAYGKESSCVWAGNWGWTYFRNYSTTCAGSTLTVCYTSKGSCG